MVVVVVVVTCRLTAKNRDQLRNPTSGNRVRATFTFFIPFSKLSEWRSAVSSTAHVASILHLALLIISNARRRSTDPLETQPTRTDRRDQRTFQPCCPTSEKHIGVGFATGRDAADCGVYDRSKRLATGKHRSTRPAHVPAPLSETQATRRSSLSARSASYPHRSGS